MERAVTIVNIDCDIKLFIPNYALPNKLAGFKQILTDKKLTRSSKLVYSQLCEYVGRNLLAWPSVESIAEKLNLSYYTVVAALKLLEHHRLILSIRRGFTKTNLYALVWQEEFSIELQNIAHVKFSDLDKKLQAVELSYLQKKCTQSTSCNVLSTPLEVDAVHKNSEVINLSNQVRINTSYLSVDGPPSNPTLPPKFDSQHNDKCDYVKAESGRVIELTKDRTPAYRREVHELFDYWNKLGVHPIHRLESKAGRNCLFEINAKLRAGITKDELISVFDKYKLSFNHPKVRPRMNKGKPINLYNLLDNKKYGGLYDWWDFFSKNGIDEIVDHYTKGKRQKTVINQIDYDDRPDLTRKIVAFYCNHILGDPNAIDLTTIGTDPRYEKFKETGKLVSSFWKKNKTHPLFKTEMSVMERLFKALQTLDKPIAIGSLCSDYTWKTVFPDYLKKQNMVGIKWGK